jgi:hypothetical protein
MFSSFSRRQILSFVSFMFAGTIVAGSTPFLFFGNKVQAQETLEEVYKGRRYRIVTDQTSHRNTTIDTTFDTKIQLFIDEQKVRIVQNKKTQKYATPLLFGEFNSPQEVARILIDLGVKLPSSEVKLDPNVD